MKLVILAMRDVKVGIYLQPFACLSIPSGVRDLQDLVNDPNGNLPWQKHPEDFELYKVGTFNAETGELVDNAPEHLLVLHTLKGVQ